MNGESPDIKQTMLQKLKGLFPELFAENQLDWEKLKAVFGEDINFANERYVLNWAGKADAFRVLQQPTTATLKPVPEESYPPHPLLPSPSGEGLEERWGGENLFIEGENLEVLKVLQKAYYGKVKVVCIDPPYNTGSDSFIYPDRFSEKKEDYLKRIGDKDEEGFLMKEGLFRKNSKDSGHFHSNWLSMMYPRLFLAKNLLRDDGVIFVHIDDNEVHNLRMVMNEIFGEENFVEEIVWNKRIPKNDKGIGNIHEYILLYVKNTQFKHVFKLPKDGIDDVYELVEKLKNKKVAIPEAEKELKKYYNKKGLDRGITLYNSLDDKYEIWGKINLSWPNGTTVGPKYEIIHPLTHKPVKIPERGWRWTKETFDGYLDNKNLKTVHDGSIVSGKIWFDKDENTQPSFIQYLKDVNDLLLKSIISLKSSGGIETEEILGKNIFPYPKPVKLIKDLLASCELKNEIVLDFFGGAGTLAEALIELNKENHSSNRFIVVQLPELTDEDSPAFKAGYKTIADIGKERIRRVIQRLTPNPSPSGEGSKGSGGSYAENLFKGASPTLFENANKLRKNKTSAEESLWQAIRNKEIENCKFRRQHPIGQFIADFYCHEKKLVIEIDGGYHNEAEQKTYDEARTQAINEFGVRVIRFTNEEILNSLPEVLKKISEALISPSPSGEGWGEVGFKVFKLSPSNFKIWRGAEIDSEEKLTEQLNAFTNPIKPGAEKQNMLYELMLKAGYELTSPLSPLSSMRGDGGEAYSINNNELIIALDTMNEKLIEQIIASKPQKVITLDSLFTGNDQLKTNTVLQMRDAGVDFKTI